MAYVMLSFCACELPVPSLLPVPCTLLLANTACLCDMPLQTNPVQCSCISFHLYVSVGLSVVLSLVLSLPVCLLGSMSVSLCVSVCMSVCLHVCPLVCLPGCLQVCLPVCLSVCLVYLPVCLPACLSVCLCLSFSHNCCSRFTCLSLWNLSATIHLLYNNGYTKSIKGGSIMCT